MTINREAFRILGEFLIRPLPPERMFSMDTYARQPNNERFLLQPNEVVEEAECGTVCCAAGHGPLAGLAPLRNEEWQFYVQRVFFNGVPYAFTVRHMGPTSPAAVYSWAFDGRWSQFDNTAVSAGHRCLYVAEHGSAPEDWGGYNPFGAYEYKNFRMPGA